MKQTVLASCHTFWMDLLVIEDTHQYLPLIVHFHSVQAINPGSQIAEHLIISEIRKAYRSCCSAQYQQEHP